VINASEKLKKKQEYTSRKSSRVAGYYPGEGGVNVSG